MRVLPILAACVFALAGCVTAPYGNHAGASDEVNQKLAVATIGQLASLYPPSRTQFNLKQQPNDAFGAALVKLLRNRGYALLESDAGAGADHFGLDLRYIVDAPVTTNLYLVTVVAGEQSLSRAFVLHRGSVRPASPWTRKE